MLKQLLSWQTSHPMGMGISHPVPESGTTQLHNTAPGLSTLCKSVGLALGLASIGLVPTTLYAAAGDLDTSFGTGGKVTTAIGTGGDYGRAVAIDGNGKIVVAGTSNNGRDNYFAVVRYLSDGSLDLSFGTGGKVTTAIGSRDDRSYAVAIDGSGKIVVAGSSYYNGYNGDDIAVVRYLSDGSLDLSFGTGGKVTTAIGSGDDYGYAVAIDDSGKIVVAGYSVSGSRTNTDVAVVRYLSDGSLDTSFDSDGKVTTNFGSFDIRSFDRGYAVAIDDSGKIVVAGSSNNGSGKDFAVVRYLSDGSLDLSFDSDGKVTTAIGSGTSTDQGYAVAIDDSGKIVVAGYSYGSNNDFAVVRYLSDGSLDLSFDSDGKVTTAIGSGTSTDQGYAVAIDDSGKIVVAGYSYGSNNDFAVVRYLSDGSLDLSFDSDGKVTTAIGSNYDYGNAVAIDDSGKIVVAGESGSNYDFAVVRYDYDAPDGDTCQLYAVHDGGLNDSQLFTVNQTTLEVNALGKGCPGCDIEALDSHPQTDALFAASGDDTDKKGYLYQVNQSNGDLTIIGNIVDDGEIGNRPKGYDYKEVNAISFRADGSLWGGAENEGLLLINTSTAQAKLVVEYAGEIEDMTWNEAGTTLYGVENLHNDPVDSHGAADFEAGVRLLAYEGERVKSVCQGLMNGLEIEALETLPGDLLLFGFHGSHNMNIGVIEPSNCNLIAEKTISTPYNDVEGIAWPAKSCAK